MANIKDTYENKIRARFRKYAKKSARKMKRGQTRKSVWVTQGGLPSLGKKR